MHTDTSIAALAYYRCKHKIQNRDLRGAIKCVLLVFRRQSYIIIATYPHVILLAIELKKKKTNIIIYLKKNKVFNNNNKYYNLFHAANLAGSCNFWRLEKIDSQTSIWFCFCIDKKTKQPFWILNTSGRRRRCTDDPESVLIMFIPEKI